MSKKLLILIILILIAAITIAYFVINQSKSCGDLIIKQSEINSIQINKGQHNTVYYKLSNQQVISELMTRVNDITLKKLTKEQERVFFVDQKRLLTDDFYSLSFSNANQKLGELLIWPDGNIIIPDIKTALSSKRTITYRTIDLHPEIYAYIKKLVE